MGWVSWVELFCAISSLIAAIKIACVQYRQAEQMKQFELRQDASDEARYAAKNRAQAIEFISMHYSDRGLIPLCAIAAMHNRLFCYSREIYRSYCCLVPEVQNLILEYLELDLRVKPESNLFERCTAAVEGELLSRFPAVITPFYDNGKYLIRSLERYAGAKIPQGRISVNPNYSSDVPLASEDGVDIQLYLQDIVIKLDEAFRLLAPGDFSR